MRPSHAKELRASVTSTNAPNRVLDASVCRTDARKTTAEAEWSARPQQNLQREGANAN